MRKKYSIIFICLVMITLNAICLNWAIQQERMKELAVTTASDRKQILSLLLGNMQMHYTYSGTFIKYYKISQLIHTQSIAN